MRATVPSPRRGFTLIELLVVIAIVAVLAVTVILVLNPAELLKQARDSNRLADLNTLNKSLSIVEAEVANASFGTSTILYVSIPDSSATCANLGLPLLPAGYTYGCAPTSTLRNTNGTGWIPVNFNLVSSGSPLSALPVDPVNTTSTGLFYTYVPGGSWELTALMESAKNATLAARDGGVDPAMLEVGSDVGLDLSPFAHGLVGFWSFDEGSGSSAGDGSARGNVANVSVGTPTWLTASSCKKNGCISFAGNSSFSVNANSSFNNYPGARTFSIWMYRSDTNAFGHAISQSYTNAIVGNFMTGRSLFLSYTDGPVQKQCDVSASVLDNQWNHITVVQNRTATGGFIAGYLNGVMVCNIAGNFSSSPSTPLNFGSRGGDQFFVGRLDDIRLYNRALSAAEIAAIYSAAN
jgi:prepilin-type N-terminal cleavage/methylation domain-containing protein